VVWQNIIFGLVTGSVLALGAIGFSMIRQTEGFLNIAHGEYLVFGSFLGFTLTQDLGLNLVLAAVLTWLAIGAGGIALAWTLFDPIHDRGPLVLMFTSVGLAYALYGVSVALFGTDIAVYSVDFGATLDLGVASLTVVEAVIIVLAFVVAVGLWLFLTFTPLGMWIRATATDPDLARVRGVNGRLVSAAVWFIAAGLAGVAGILFSILGTASVELGWQNILLIVAITVLGGVGKIYGVFAAAMLLGVIMSLSTLVIPATYQTTLAFGVLVLVLVFRPEGLFAHQRRREQAA
jgi:branched-chain amino acid transport system permease protein